MRRHPYAMHGMGNPMMKWWYDMACFYMGWAMPHGWDGGHYPSDHGRCSDGDSCGYRGCHAHHGDSRARETPSLSKQLCITLKHDAPVEARIELGKLCRKVSKTIRLLKHESHATIQVPVTLDPEDTSKVTIDVPKGAEPGRYEGVLSDDGNVVAVIFLDIKTAG